jgi:signal transduction histidine kinase
VENRLDSRLDRLGIYQVSKMKESTMRVEQRLDLLVTEAEPHSRIEAEARVLDGRAAEWVVAGGFTYRAFLLPASLLAGWAFVSRHAAEVVPLVVVLTAANAILAIMLARGRWLRALRLRWFIYIDVAIAVAANIATPLFIPKGEILTTGADIYWYYLLGTIFIWTALNSARMGAILVAIGVPVEILMIRENHAIVDGAGVVQALGRVGWLAAGAIVPWVILVSATRGSRRAVEGAAIASHEAERGRVFGDLHDVVSQAFGEIVRRTGHQGYVAEVVEHVGAFAGQQADVVAAEFDEPDLGAASLLLSLQALEAEFTQGGLAVQFEVNGDGIDLPGGVQAALTGATREALNNVRAHSGARQSWLQLRYLPTAVEITIADRGIGYDVDRVSYRMGIPQSIVSRIERVGGSARVTSTPGTGTVVELEVPVSRDEADDVPEPLRSLASFSREALAEESLGWFAVPALVYRASLTPLQVALAYGTLHTDLSPGLWTAMGLVWLYDLSLLYAALSGRFRTVFKSAWLFVLDVVIAITINLFAVSELPTGSALVPGHEFLWGYTFGTVVLWTALRGARIGAMMIIVSAALEAAIIMINSINWATPVFTVFTAQVIKALAALILSLLITGLARQGFKLAVKSGAAAGMEHARAEELRSLCDRAIGDLRQIADICADGALSVQERTREVRGIALQAVSQLRSKLNLLAGVQAEADSAATRDLVATIDEFRRLGLRIEFVQSANGGEPPAEVTEMLRTSLREALDNAFKYSGARHIVVRMEIRTHDSEIVVRDHGVGFKIAGSDDGSSQRITQSDGNAGYPGTVETWSEPGGGTRVRIAVRW